METDNQKTIQTASAPPLRRNWRSRLLWLLALLVILAGVIVMATAVGSVDIPPGITGRIILDRLPFISLTPDWSAAQAMIVWDIRLPRVLLAALVGAALSIAGATYQGLFRNPLADPYLIGVAQGAALGAVIGFLLPVAGVGLSLGIVPLMAFLGALGSVAVVYGLARVGKTLPMSTLILAGVALGALLGAIVAYLTLTSGQMLRSILFWLSGSFALSQWNEVYIVAPIVLLSAVVLIIFSRSLNIMQLDEEQAQQLGVNVEWLKITLLAVATLITAAAVSFAGIIGFVGIIVPHAVRLLWGPDNRFLLPLSMVCGAILMILGDLLARTLITPSEIPIGVIMAMAGARLLPVYSAPPGEDAAVMLTIQAEKLTLGYGGAAIVKGLSFALKPGQMTGIVGPNGCGKSTIIKALSRVLMPVSGRVTINERDIRHISRLELARLGGVVPQIPLLPSAFTGFEAVLMGRNPHLGLFQYESEKDMSIAMEAMRATRTDHLAARRIGELSGGEIQSVVIARVLAQETQAILMDEPTANLDIGRQIEVLDLMQALCGRGLTVAVALHDLNLAAQYCKHLILLSDGGIAAEGVPEEVITERHIRAVYGAGSAVYSIDGLPAVLPRPGRNREMP